LGEEDGQAGRQAGREGKKRSSQVPDRKMDQVGAKKA